MKNRPRFASCNLINEKNKDEDFVIFDLKYVLSIRNNRVTTDHIHNFYQIIYIKKGTGKNVIDGIEYNLKKNDIFFIVPGQTHKWDLNDNIEGFVLNFTEDFVSNFLAVGAFILDLPFFQNLTTHNVINVVDKNVRIESIFDKMLYENQLIEGTDFILLKVYLIELLILFKKHIDAESSFNYKTLQPIKLIKQFEGLVEKYFYDLRFPKEYAKLLNVTPNYLNSTCKRVKGQSAGELIRNRILLESKRLLLNTNMSASEIAFKLSFKDNSYFSRFFKKYVGIAPDEYRNS